MSNTVSFWSSMEPSWPLHKIGPLNLDSDAIFSTENCQTLSIFAPYWSHGTKSAPKIVILAPQIYKLLKRIFTGKCQCWTFQIPTKLRKTMIWKCENFFTTLSVIQGNSLLQYFEENFWSNEWSGFQYPKYFLHLCFGLPLPPLLAKYVKNLIFLFQYLLFQMNQKWVRSSFPFAKLECFFQASKPKIRLERKGVIMVFMVG